DGSSPDSRMREFISRCINTCRLPFAVLATSTGSPRRTASLRAKFKVPMTEFVAAVRRLESINRVKPGTAMVATIAISAITIINSINVNPRWCARDRMQLLPEIFVMFIQYRDTKKPPRFYDKWRFTEDKRKRIPRSVIQIKRLPHQSAIPWAWKTQYSPPDQPLPAALPHPVPSGG